MTQRQQKTNTDVNVGVNYNPLFGGFGFTLNYSNATEENSTSEPQVPAITGQQVQAIEPEASSSNHSRGASSSGNHNQSELIAFYKNEIKSVPNGDYIENILKHWRDDYEKLDNFNTYIQWLFPGRELGKNPQAPVVTDEDIEIIKYYGFNERALRGFAMMVKFYGMEVQDSMTIVLAPNYRERLQKITSHGKYYFVITRILSFLKELGEQTLMTIWLKMLADLIQKNLLDEDAKNSFNSYWIKTLDSDGFAQVKEHIRRINSN